MAREAGLVVFGAIAFGLAFGHPMLGHLGETPAHHDWGFFSQLAWAARTTLLRFHQLPLWNPYKCGGLPLLGNPESRIVTPFLLLQLLAGPTLGQRLEIPLHLAVGWGGGYVLARVLGCGPLGGIVCGSLFPASSWFFLHMAAGHLVFLPALYLPWVCVLAWLAFERRRVAPAAAGLVLAIAFGEGGVYPVLYAFLLLGLVAGTLAVSQGSLRPLVTVVVVAVFAFGFAAVKLLPAYDMMQANPRPVGGDANTAGALATALFSRDQDLERTSVGSYGFWEYGAYVSPLAIGLALVGLVAARPQALPWAIAAGTLLALALGSSLGPASPWALLQKLPVYSTARVPSRLLIPFTFTVAVLAAFGAERLRRWRPPLGALAAPLLAAALVVDAWLVGVPNLRHVFGEEEVVVPPSPTFRQIGTREAYGHMLAYNKANVGAVRCYENTLFHTNVQGADRFDYKGEQYLLGPGSVRLVEWTPNMLRYEVEAPADAVLIVNQNYDPAWRVVGGAGDVFSYNRLIAVRLPAGTRRVALAYRSPWFRAGLMITALTFVALVIIWRRT